MVLPWTVKHSFENYIASTLEIDNTKNFIISSDWNVGQYNWSLKSLPINAFVWLLQGEIPIIFEEWVAPATLSPSQEHILTSPWLRV